MMSLQILWDPVVQMYADILVIIVLVSALLCLTTRSMCWSRIAPGAQGVKKRSSVMISFHSSFPSSAPWVSSLAEGRGTKRLRLLGWGAGRSATVGSRLSPDVWQGNANA
jgi:hypothetical protein